MSEHGVLDWDRRVSECGSFEESMRSLGLEEKLVRAVGTRVLEKMSRIDE